MIIQGQQEEVVKTQIYLVYMESGHLSGIVGAVSAGCLCFPSELKQMSAETPALAQPPPPPPLPACRPRVSGVATLSPKYTHRSAPEHAIVLSTAADFLTH